MKISVDTPDWVKHAIFYQIFPDRFRRSTEVDPPAGVVFKPWGSDPQEQGFQGGDLYGVAEKLDYLKGLGISAIYLNPIFSSAANHRYHTFDYYQVDPLLGGTPALRKLLDEAHARDMRIVLDGVFNHASRGFWPFHHILENGASSPYLDWFIIHDWPLRPYQEGNEKEINYAAWWQLPALPKLNTENKAVQQFILDVAKYWLEFGVDGWRLDVPAEIDDPIFWRRFRQVVKTANPEAYICGEIWEEAKDWLQGDQFDAVMNYTFSWATMTFCGSNTLRKGYKRNHLSLIPRTAAESAKVVDEMYGWYDWGVNLVQLNLLDSHDTARALWVMGDDVDALKLCVLMQMTMPGAPCIYYGDEIGMSAGDDPFCREAFPWEDESVRDEELLAHYRKACALRNEYEILRIGDFETIFTEKMVWVYRRTLGEDEAYIIINAGQLVETMNIDVSGRYWEDFSILWPGQEEIEIDAGEKKIKLSIPGRSACILLASG